MKLRLLSEDTRITKQPLKRFGNISIYLVNGEQIRSISPDFEEFNESASHQLISQIPENEGWIEDSISRDELPYVIYGLVVGMLHDDYKTGIRAEKAERSKALPSKHGPYGKPDQEIYQLDLGIISGVRFYLINAEAVRDQYKVDFCLGGNHGAYDWVPTDEIWLDIAIHKSELPFVALHEFFERAEILDNGHNYNDAHKKASALEWKARERKKIPQQYAHLMYFVRNAINR
jgi:hypothetical protein